MFRVTELGVTLSRPGGDATALEGRFGAALDRADLALRAGNVDPGRPGNGHFIAGVEARVPVLGHSPTFPLDGAFISVLETLIRSRPRHRRRCRFS